jgi:glycosyltransferase involved in cell wall biosynthesis
MKARIINVNNTGNIHEIFNASLGYMAANIFDSVEYVCAVSVEKVLRNLFRHYGLEQQLEKIKFTSISEHDMSSRWKKLGIIRALKDLKWVLTMHGNSVAILQSSNAYFIWLNAIINFFFRKKVWIFFHAELEHFYVRKDKWLSALQRILFISFFCYGCSPKTTTYCVLGKSILKNMQPFLSNCQKRRFTSINHPIFISENADTKVNETLKIGTIGNMNKGRGLQTLLEVADKLKGQVTISVIGAVTDFVDYDRYAQIDFAVRRISNQQHYRAPLTREEFDHELSSLDYILFLIPQKAYQLAASGSLYDALILEKPIISFHNDFFDEVISLPCGYWCDNEDEIVQKILELKTNYPHNDDYHNFILNMRAIRDAYHIENVGQQWYNEIEKMYGKLCLKF